MIEHSFFFTQSLMFVMAINLSKKALQNGDGKQYGPLRTYLDVTMIPSKQQDRFKFSSLEKAV